MMMLLFVLSAVSQTDALFTGTVPAEIPTFSVTLSGAAPFYAAMQVGGQWVTDRNQEIKSTQEVEFVPDIPWRTHEVVRTSMRRAAVSYEAPAMRRERLAKTWKSMGYTILETASGWSPVKEKDIQLAERAKSMAENLEKRLRPVSDAPAAAEAAAVPEDAGAAMRPAILWTLRAAIVLVGLSLAGALFYFTRP